MTQIVDQVINNLEELLLNSPPFLGFFLGMFIIMLESMIPMLPLAVFIVINVILFGGVIGFLMSWIATIVGCLLMFAISRKYFSNFFDKKTKNSKRIKKIMHSINEMKFSTLVLITALPFTPAFLINIGSGLSKMSYKKFLINIILSKAVVVYFWGYIGTSLIESITDVKVLIKLGLLLGITYIISKIIMKKNKIR